MHSPTYVDVCDSRGLTALHFATHNLHFETINCLLDFGANVNQLTDDGLTPLAIAFLFYYGNDPQETINMALEHSDALVSNSQPSPRSESHGASSKEKSTLSRSASEMPIPDETKSACNPNTDAVEPPTPSRNIPPMTIDITYR